MPRMTFPSILRRTFPQQLFRSLRVLRGDPIGAGDGGKKCSAQASVRARARRRKIGEGSFRVGSINR